MQYIISNIRLPFYCGDDEIIKQAVDRMKRVGCYDSALHFRLYKRSIDARNKENILSVSSVIAEDDAKNTRVCDLSAFGITVLDSPQYRDLPLLRGSEKICGRPLVVGMGPAGLFCALLLAENGYSPILIDRGGSVSERASDVERFYKDHILDTESNIQFGEGGAGTFSDGKLVTRINDPRCGYVLERFHDFGAPDDILTKAKPHVGTDILRRVVASMTKRIRALGGTVIYRCRLEGIYEYADGSVGAATSKGEIQCGAAVLATGHSARDLYFYLRDAGFTLTPKPFSVGVRVEHLQEDIDRALFGRYAGHPMLGKGEYSLSDTTGERGVYTFCMCPGGEVVGGSSEVGTVVVNGMSNRARDGKNANCATAVSVTPTDVERYMRETEQYRDYVGSAIGFQRRLERLAFEAGGKNYNAPVQLMKDFLNGTHGAVPHRIMPTYMGGNRFKVGRISDVLPKFVTETLIKGFHSFDRKIHGFACDDAVLTAVESRTTSPIRILRDESMRAEGHKNIYPCGEGAGYAGGITSAAVDGVRCAEAIISRFVPPDGGSGI